MESITRGEKVMVGGDLNGHVGEEKREDEEVVVKRKGQKWLW